MNDEITFGQVVKERRNLLGLTQVELAGRVGCAAITIRRIEANTLRPSTQMAELLAVALAVPDEEQYAFIRLARAEKDPSPLPTPAPLPGEIGLEDLSGRAVKGFQLGEKIGSGGFGVVYRALQPSVERDVAVKIILPRYANHPEFIRRFEAEAQIIAHLEHPHIVPLYDYWRQPSAAYLIMRLLRGGSLEDQLQQGPIPLEQVEQTTRQIGLALNAAHKHGVVHRDIKPANVLLDEEHNAYLADFGIAKNLELDDGQSLTQGNALFGSPAYISPEQILSEPVKPQSDIYCLGILLYEMLTGHKPFPGPTPVAYIQQHLNDILPSVLTENPDLPLALDEVIRQATAKNPADRFPDIPAMLAAFQTALPQAGSVTSSLGEAAITLSAEELAALENPYKGLRAFTEADADNFYGRNALIQELFTRLSDASDLARFLAVVGPSGGGKSSVVKAGLVPALRRGGLPGSENWFVVDFAPGAHPWEEVEAALLRVAVNPPESLLNQLQAGDRGLLRAINRILPDDGETELVLVVDQFEELFTLVEDEAVREQFLNSLVTAVLDERSRVRVIITLRADFYDRPLQYVDFGDLLRQRTVSVLPMTPDELELAISQPAEQIGVALEPGLAATIIRDVGDQPGTLPLLQYALTELFERRDGRLLTLAAYQEIGGVTGALARRADEIYASLDEAGQEASRQLFLRLITLGEGVEDTRRRVRLSELEALSTDHRLPATDYRSLITEYGRHRLLTFDHDPATREPTVEVAHEALLREWERLRLWLDESRADVRLQRILAAATAEWLNAKRDPGFLLRGSRLDQFEGWVETTNIALTADEQAFLAASTAGRQQRRAAEEERQQRELELARLRADEQALAAQRLRRRAAILVGALVLAAFLAVVAMVNGRAASQNADQAQANAQLAATRAAEAETNAILAVTSESQALVNADLAATREVDALLSAQTAATRQSEAEAETLARATAEAVAEQERMAAEEQAVLATGRELAAAALVGLDADPERSILLAQQSLITRYTREGEEALRQALLASRARLTLRQDSVHDVTYSPDGAYLVTMSGDEGLGVERITTIWDAATGDQLLTFPAGDEACGERCANAVAISPDGSLLAVQGDDNNILILDFVATLKAGLPQEVSRLEGHTAVVQRMSFSPDGTRLATASEDSTVKVWDAASGNELLSLDVPIFFCCYGPTFSPDGSLLIVAPSASAVEMRFYDARSGDLLLTGPGEASTYALSPDGARLITGGINDGLGHVWDVAASLDAGSAQELFTFPMEGIALNFEFNADGSILAASMVTGQAELWAIGEDSAEQVITLASLESLIGLAVSSSFSPDGRYLATAGRDGIRVWDVGPGGRSEYLTLSNPDGSVRNVAVSPDGTRLVTTTWAGTVRIWDSNTGELLLTIPAHEGVVMEAAFSPDGLRLVTAGGEDNTAKVWDPSSGEELAVLDGHGEGNVGGLFFGVLSAAFSPDGQFIATGGVDGVVQLWDATTYQPVRTMVVHPDRPGVTRVAFSPDGRLLAASTASLAEVSDGVPAILKVWDTATGEPVQDIIGLPDYERLWSVAFSPDGSRLAASGGAGTARVWDLASGEQLLQLDAPEITIGRLIFSPDGRQLATAGADGIARLWDAESGELLLRLAGHEGFFNATVAFTPDGSRLVTGGNDRTARVYLLQIDELLTLAQSRATRSLTDAECQQYLHVDTCPVNSN